MEPDKTSAKVPACLPVENFPQNENRFIKEAPPPAVSVTIDCSLSNTSQNQVEKHIEEIYKICKEDFLDSTLSKEYSVSFFKKFEQQAD